MVYDLGVLQVELDQLVVTFPALVPESIIIIGIAVEADVEPILVRRVPFILLDILERPETASNVVEHTVEDNADAVAVQAGANVGEIGIGAQSAVDAAEITGVVAVRVGLEEGREVDRVRTQCADMFDPVTDLADAALVYAVIDARCAAETDRINLIKYAFVCPHKTKTPFLQGNSGKLLVRLPGAFSISDSVPFVQSAQKKTAKPAKNLRDHTKKCLQTTARI